MIVYKFNEKPFIMKGDCSLRELDVNNYMNGFPPSRLLAVGMGMTSKAKAGSHPLQIVS